MHKAGAILLILFLTLPVLLVAQEEDSPFDPEWDFYDDLYSRGDQTFVITLGTVYPAFFRYDGDKKDHNFTPPVGGIGSLSYNYFFAKEVFAGAEIGGMFIHTLGGNTLFLIPLGVKGGYQFTYWKFEFPVSATLGMVWHRYTGLGYFGIYTKIGGSAFYRASTTWSFGLNANWYWFPQWTGETEKNAHGNFLDTTISARYHF